MIDHPVKFKPPENDFIARYQPGDFLGREFKFLPLSARPSVNLVNEGRISPVKSQLPCSGACTAFSFAALIESYHLAITNKLYDVGAAWIHNCSSGVHCDNGADPETVSMQLSDSYVPRASQGSVPWDSDNCDILRDIYAPVFLPCSGDDQVKYTLASGSPVAAAMDIDYAFINWTGRDPFVVNPNGVKYSHMVVITGYDNTSRLWRIKNSLGSAWGDNGYFHAPYRSSGLGDYAAYGMSLPPIEPHQ
ncbi:MAG: C1 family peptidase [Alphaproteobacteria bacterium]